MLESELAKGLIEATPKGIADTGNDIWGLILGDRIAYFRRKNAMKLSKLLHEEAQRLGGKLDPTRVPDQFAFEWGEAATRKSDDTLQKMFARLLANAATENGSHDERLIYSIRELSGEDAVLFNALYRMWTADHGWRGGEISASHVHALERELEIGVEVALDNLLRLSLVRESAGLSNSGGGYDDWDYASSGSSVSLNLSVQRLIGRSALGMLLYAQVRDETEVEALDPDPGRNPPRARRSRI